ncbi:MAG: hypothetical protein ACREEB_12230 [Caulobacteraceae bacterium]
MSLDSTLIAGLIGAGFPLIPGAVAFFVGWGSIRATIAALKARVGATEDRLGKIDQIQADVSYIRGIMDGEARAGRGVNRG